MLCSNCIFYGSCKNMIHSKECVNNRNIYNMAKAEGIKQGKAEGIDEAWNKLIKYERAIENANYPFNFIQIAFDELREEQK